MNKNKVDLILKVIGYEDISAEDITQLLGVQPTKIIIKGTPRNPKNINSPL